MLFRRAAALLLLLVFFARAFNRYMLIADYYLNTAAYAANCINKARPSMHCNGHCQLCKRMRQQDNSDNQRAPERKSGTNGSETLYSAASFAEFTALHLRVPNNLTYPELPAGRPVGVPRDIFHPPGNRLA